MSRARHDRAAADEIDSAMRLNNAVQKRQLDVDNNNKAQQSQDDLEARRAQRERERQSASRA